MRRGNIYDGILMDPPSYGRGPGGEVWKLENELYGLVESLRRGARPTTPLFFLINSYTTGFQASGAEQYARHDASSRRFGGQRRRRTKSCLPVTAGGVLPCGASGRWQAR